METRTPDEIVRAFPDDWWKRPTTPRILSQWFSRYMIGLHLVVLVKGELQQVVYSGFALYHAGCLVWATAGHIVDQVIQIRARLDAKILRAAWLDNCSVIGAGAVPAIDFKNTPLLTGTPFGYDVGAASLRLAELMLAGNPDLNVMYEEGWRNRANAKAEGFYLLGFPSDWITDRIDPAAKSIEARVSAELVCVPVERVDPPDDAQNNPFWSHPNAFFGRVMHATSNSYMALDDIDGTSGGMLLSIERTDTGGMRYRLFGIQSAWLRSSRTLRAEPIEALAALLEAVAPAPQVP
jgi:hypothetical protein